MLYHSSKIINSALLDELWEHRQDKIKLEQSQMMYSGGDRSKTGEVVLDSRNTLVAKQIDYRLYPEICKDLQEGCNNIYDEDLRVNQFNYLVYLKGMYFKPHQDIPEDLLHYRKYTSITLMYKSQDYAGGNLGLHVDGKNIQPQLEVGETLVFPSTWLHWVDPVQSGRREVLVAWLH